MANTVKTIFTADASNLFRVADQAKQRIQSVGQFANSPGSVAGGDLRKQLLDLRAIETSKQANLRTELAQLRVEKERLTIAEKLRATERREVRQQERVEKATKAQAIKEELALEKARATEVAAIHKQTAENAKQQQRIITYATRERIANELKAEKAAERERFGLTSAQRYGRINLARQGADVFTQLGSGQGLGIVAIQQGPQIIEAMAESGFKLNASLIGSVARIGAIAVAGYALVNVSESLLSDADRRLALEEKIQGAYNKQIFTLRAITAEYEQQRALTQQNRIVSQQLTQAVGQGDSGSIATIQKQADERTRASLQRVHELRRNLEIVEANITSTESRETSGWFARNSIVMQQLGLIFTEGDKKGQLGQLRDQARQLKEALALLQQELSSNQSIVTQADTAAFDVIKTTKENAKAYASAEIQAQADIAQARLRGNEENIALIRESGEAQEAVIRRNLSLLSEEQIARGERIQLEAQLTIAQMENQRAVEEAQKRQKEKTDEIRKNYASVLSDLTVSASRGNVFTEQMFRAADASQKVREQLKEVPAVLRIAAEQQQSLINSLDAYQVGLQSKFNIAEGNTLLRKFTEPTQAERQGALNRQISEFQRVSNSTNPDVFYNFQTRQRAIDQFDRINLQRELDEKLATTRGRLTEGERRIADRALVDLAKSVSPDEIRIDQRQEIAEAIKRDLETRKQEEAEARKAMADFTAALNGFNKNVAEGKFGQLNISLNDATGQVQRATSPTPQTVNLGQFSSGGGLTSF